MAKPAVNPVARLCKVHRMGELLKRPYRTEDAAALAGLLNLLGEHAGGHGGLTATDVNATIATTVGDVALDTTMVFSRDGDLVAAVGTLSPPTGGYRADVFGGVDPQWRGRGLGRELLGAQLDRAAAIHRAAAPADDWQVHADARARDEDAQRLYRRFDMAPVRYWFEMTAPTEGAVAVPPPGLRVRTYAPDAEKALYETHSEAFRDHWGYQRRGLEDWADLTVRMDHFLPEASYLAYDGEELVGYVLSYRESVPGRLYVGQVGTGRSWRRRGVAGGLLSAVMASAATAGYETVSLGVDAESPTGAVGVYERVGFTVAARGVTYSRDLPGVT
jgi:mycothiol synthase